MKRPIMSLVFAAVVAVSVLAAPAVASAAQAPTRMLQLNRAAQTCKPGGTFRIGIEIDWGRVVTLPAPIGTPPTTSIMWLKLSGATINYRLAVGSAASKPAFSAVTGRGGVVLPTNCKTPGIMKAPTRKGTYTYYVRFAGNAKFAPARATYVITVK